MSMFDKLPVAPRARPQYNVGCLFDIPSGNIIRGKDGEPILNGGVAVVNSVAGPGNVGKTEILNFFFFKVMAGYGCSTGLVYDTESSLTYDRLNRSANRHEKLADVDLSDPSMIERFRLTQSADILGDEYFDAIKEVKKERVKNGKKLWIETPFIGDNQEPIKVMKPILVDIDSLTEFKVSSVQDKLVDKNAVGESGANTQFMKDGAAKTQMITQLPNMGTQGGLCFFLVAHIGMGIDMDPYAPKAPKLTHSRSGTKTKGVPEKFSFINNNLYEIFDAKMLWNSSADKAPKYPATEEDRVQGNTDLTLIHMVQTRNKNGPSGVKYELVMSQREGLLEHLTMYHFLKEENYGFEGNNTTFALNLLPDVKLQRTTVRNLIDENPRLRRAIEFTTHLRQMRKHWRNIDPTLHIYPDELYTKIIEQGYDWEVLYNTRGNWMFVEEEKGELPYLSTVGLLEMAAGRYKPKWYAQAKKALEKK